jgi:hypothetical protein
VRMSSKRRVAIGEQIRTVELLTKAKTPHARELACIILLRVKEVAVNDAPIYEASDEDIANMLKLANLLEPEAVQ